MKVRKNYNYFILHIMAVLCMRCSLDYSYFRIFLIFIQFIKTVLIQNVLNKNIFAFLSIYLVRFIIIYLVKVFSFCLKCILYIKSNLSDIFSWAWTFYVAFNFLFLLILLKQYIMNLFFLKNCPISVKSTFLDFIAFLYLL